MVRTSPPPEATESRARITHVVCPYLLAADGGWRASSPSRDHRCTAVAPAAILAPEKQRRLCLSVEHTTCATYLAAMEAVGVVGGDGGSVAVPARSSARDIVRTTPVVLDHGRVGVSMPALRRDARLAQASLIGLMVLAFAAILLARSPAPSSPPGAGAGGPTTTPTSTAAATAASTALATRTTAPATPPPGASDAPTRTLVPTENEPSPVAQATPNPTTAGTYKVKRGDTLSGIATAKGTTWQVLAELNHIEDPARLRVGQVLQLP